MTSFSTAVNLYAKMVRVRDDMKQAFGTGYDQMIAPFRLLVGSVAKKTGRSEVEVMHEMSESLKKQFPDWRSREDIKLDLWRLIAATVDLMEADELRIPTAREVLA